jgi:hypothetical protein
MRENLRHPLVTPTLRGVHHLALCTDDMKAATLPGATPEWIEMRLAALPG